MPDATHPSRTKPARSKPADRVLFHLGPLPVTRSRLVKALILVALGVALAVFWGRLGVDALGHFDEGELARAISPDTWRPATRSPPT